MEEQSHNHPAKQNWQTHVESDTVNRVPPLIQHISQDEAVTQLWSYIQLSHCKLSTQRDAIISVLATQLTLCIKAPCPAPVREKGALMWSHRDPPPHSTASHVYKQTHNISTSYTIKGRVRDEVREPEAVKVRRISLWQTLHVDEGQKREGWMGEGKKI